MADLKLNEILHCHELSDFDIVLLYVFQKIKIIWGGGEGRWVFITKTGWMWSYLRAINWDYLFT